MKNLLATAVVCISVGVAIGFGTASFGLSPHDHSGHPPVSIPDSWTDAQVAAFIAESDRKIDAWAGRVIAPGEVIIHDGLEFTKSTPEMVAQRSCNFCPVRNACHNGGVLRPSPAAEPRPATARRPQHTPLWAHRRATPDQRATPFPRHPSGGLVARTTYSKCKGVGCKGLSVPEVVELGLAPIELFEVCHALSTGAITGGPPGFFAAGAILATYNILHHVYESLESEPAPAQTTGWPGPASPSNNPPAPAVSSMPGIAPGFSAPPASVVPSQSSNPGDSR